MTGGLGSPAEASSLPEAPMIMPAGERVSRRTPGPAPPVPLGQQTARPRRHPYLHTRQKPWLCQKSPWSCQQESALHVGRLARHRPFPLASKQHGLGGTRACGPGRSPGFVRRAHGHASRRVRFTLDAWSGTDRSPWPANSTASAAPVPARLAEDLASPEEPMVEPARVPTSCKIPGPAPGAACGGRHVQTGFTSQAVAR